MATMYAALSATNEALLYATDGKDLYQRVCDAAVSAGGFLTAAVMTPEGKGSASMRVEASAGPFAPSLEEVIISIDDTTAEGRGLVGQALRSQAPAVSNDYRNDPRTRPWHEVALRGGVASGAALPFGRGGHAKGVLLLYSAAPDAFTEDTLALLERMARNLAFALDNFEHEADRQRALQALQRSEEKSLDILESLDDAYYEVDVAGRPVHYNGAFFRMLGHQGRVSGLDYKTFQTPEMAATVFKTFNEVFRTGVSQSNQHWQFVHNSGRQIHVEGSIHLVRDEQGQPKGFRGILRDITRRLEMDRALRDSEERFRALTNLSSDWYWEVDTDSRFTRMDSRMAQDSAMPHPLLGKIIWETPFGIQDKDGWAGFQATMAAREKFRDVIMHRVLADGTPYYISLSGEPLYDTGGRCIGYRGITKEITDQKVAEEQIQYLAQHDVLTGLPNRSMFSNLLNVAIATAMRTDRRFAVFFIDLDRFKFINDTLGHEAGDTLLKEITSRFKQTLRSSDVISRLGGDEFVVLVQDVGDVDQASVVATKMLHAAIRPFSLMDQECRVTASIGIALFPEDGSDEQTLMKHADSAMYYAKEEGKNNFQFYSKEINSQSLERLTLETNLRTALEREEFSLNYQAKVDLKSNAITGVEALLRWHNPALGFVSPIKFIPVAEETGLIVGIGRWVLRAACRQNVAWQAQGLPPINMAINISARQFADDSLVRDIAQVLQETGMDPTLLELEITEGMIIHSVDRAIKLLTAIKAMGVRLAIDDFGTGYSSLGQLKNFPIDTLKVDRSFIRDLATDSEDKAITTAIIAMGKTLSLTVVAEGVETLEQQNFLRDQACDEMQGYYFSKPVAPDAFAELLRSHVPGWPEDTPLAGGDET
jgi:diguanylate cyclase (GGDEF)-like protein/PAS domain S-box-containing protein